MSPRGPRRAELDVTLEEYKALFAAQGGGCALCGNPPKTRRLDVDHDHRTGLIRGLLCQRCNRAIPSERYMPAGVTLAGWGMAVHNYGVGFPASLARRQFRQTLDAINQRRKDGGS